MGTLKTFQIFRAGTHTTTNGTTREYTTADLHYMAAAYLPERRPAPLVLGHPQNQAAVRHFGEVVRLTVKGSILHALARVSDALVGMVRAGSYRRVSASFAQPYAPGNPVPDAFYLNHVGFLGAVPPAVRGLEAPSFAEFAAPSAFSFSEGGDVFQEMVNPAFHDPEAIARRIVHYQQQLPGLSFAQVCHLVTNR